MTDTPDDKQLSDDNADVEYLDVSTNSEENERSEQILKQLIDTHSHVTDDKHVLKKLRKLKVDSIVMVSCTQEDWALITRVKMEQLTIGGKSHIIPAFGIHPWHVYKPRSADWLNQLRTLLLTHKDSIVGETGLDKVAKHPKLKKVLWDEQVAAFTAQFDLACELAKPITVHCVQAFGYMHDFFRARSTPPISFPPVVIMHSYSGTDAMVRSLIKIPHIGQRIYFGFSYIINVSDDKPSDKLVKAIQAVPEERLLLESDHIEINEAQTGLLRIIHIIAAAKSWTIEKVVEVTSTNARRALKQLAGE